MRLLAITLLALMAVATGARAADRLTLYAAGSLKAALGDVAKAYEEAYGTPVGTDFAASGLLRERIEAGERPDVFASANMAHPQALMVKGLGGPVALFARNRLCALAQPDLEVATASVLDVMLRKDVRLGTSTPRADPSGDYAWELFDKAEACAREASRRWTPRRGSLPGGRARPSLPKGATPTPG